MKWKNWSDFKVLHSIQLRKVNWSKIEILFLNSQARFRNYKIKLIVWMIREIFKMLNQYVVDIPTLSVSLCLSHLIQFWRNAKSFYRNAESQRRSVKYLGHTWYIGKRFCKSRCVIFSTLSAGIESMEFQYRRVVSFIHSGKEWETNTRSRSEMSVWTVSQKFCHLQWRRLFKELWGRPTTTADFGSSFRQIPYTSYVCMLEDKIQDRGLYLFTMSYGCHALDQRSGVGWFSGWIEIFVIYSWYFNAEFWSTWCEDCFSTEPNHP